MGKKSSRKMKFKNSLVAYAFMLPALIFLVIFVFYPIVYSLPLAFFDYSVIGKTHFVGWANFAKAINDSEFWISIKNVIIFSLIVPVIQILSILLAILVNKNIPGIKLFRVLFYIPVVTSMVAVAITWNFIFDPSGLLNTFLLNHGIIKNPIMFLQDPKLALLTMMFITIWQGLGYYMMIYLAGLQSLPKDVEEAGMIDGANKFTILFKIKIPLLKPYVWLCSFMSILSAVQVFDVVYVLAPTGEPNNATLVPNLFSFNKAFVDFNFGYSAAIGILIAIVTTALSVVVFIYGNKGGMSYNNG